MNARHRRPMMLNSSAKRNDATSSPGPPDLFVVSGKHLPKRINRVFTERLQNILRISNDAKTLKIWPNFAMSSRRRFSHDPRNDNAFSLQEMCRIVREGKRLIGDDETTAFATEMTMMASRTKKNNVSLKKKMEISSRK